MDPITRISKDTGVPREVLVRVVGKTITEHRVLINDDEPDEQAPTGELISLAAAARRFNVSDTTLYGWLKQGRLTDHGRVERGIRGQPRLVDADEVARLASLPRRPGPRGPRKQKPKPAYTQELAAAGQ